MMNVIFGLLVLHIITAVYSFPQSYNQVLENGLHIGESLHGKTLKQLQPFRHSVELSVGVENFSRYLLHRRYIETATGVAIKSMVDVAPGTIEAFVNSKKPVIPSGIWTRYTFDIDDDIYVHIMISAPYDFNYHRNCVAIALCGKHDKSCTTLTCEKMYYNKYPSLARKFFKSPAESPVKICYDNVCLSGYMENHHHPVAIFRLYPKSYHNLNENIRAKAVSQGRYEDYVRSIFK